MDRARLVRAIQTGAGAAWREGGEGAGPDARGASSDGRGLPRLRAAPNAGGRPWPCSIRQAMLSVSRRDESTNETSWVLRNKAVSVHSRVVQWLSSAGLYQQASGRGVFWKAVTLWSRLGVFSTSMMFILQGGLLDTAPYGSVCQTFKTVSLPSLRASRTPSSLPVTGAVSVGPVMVSSQGWGRGLWRQPDQWSVGRPFSARF